MIRGGLRTRLIIDSVRFAILSTLEQLGWFDPTVYDTPPGTRRHEPLNYIERPVDWATVITPNAIAISSDDFSDDDVGFGGEIEDLFEIYVDLFAQDDSFGWQVIFDIRDALYGKNQLVGRVGPEIDVYDFRQATPAPFTTVEIDTLRVDRFQGEAREWQRHWFMMHIVVLDEYLDEALAVSFRRRSWDPTQQTAWNRVVSVGQRTT